MFEAMATFIGQISVLSLIAIFGAATTAMVILLLVTFFLFVRCKVISRVHVWNLYSVADNNS